MVGLVYIKIPGRTAVLQRLVFMLTLTASKITGVLSVLTYFEQEHARDSGRIPTIPSHGTLPGSDQQEDLSSY